MPDARMETAMSDDQFPVSVVIYQEDGVWIAQGLQYDITARGADPIDASERFNQKIGAEFIMSMEIKEPPLSGVPRAPKEFWDMYETAKMRGFTVETTPIRTNDGPTPNIRQDIAITHERQRSAA
jgi:hypothetical protein